MANQATDLDRWKQLIDNLSSAQFLKAQHATIFTQLSTLFEHLAPQPAPRLKSDYENCTIKTNHSLEEAFDKLDLSNKPLLCTFLQTLRSFGFFRLAQITYHISTGPRDDTDLIHWPLICKTKWYDMTPLLPKAGTIGWKSIMTHGIVKEEPELRQMCAKLTTQKLKFCSIVSLLDRFQDDAPTIIRNGKKVAETLSGFIRDVSCDDQRMFGLDSVSFNLLLPFVEGDQCSLIIEAVVQDLFKPALMGDSDKYDAHTEKLFDLIETCVINRSSFQSILIYHLIEHLKCNLIRRKRRHSIEASENEGPTMEQLIGLINQTNHSQNTFLSQLVPKFSEVSHQKTFQSTYLTYWLKTVIRILNKADLVDMCSIKLLAVCSLLISTTADFLDIDIIILITSLQLRSLDCTARNKLESLFKGFDMSLLQELTKLFSAKSTPSANLILLLGDFYNSYFTKFLRCCAGKGLKSEAEKFANFVAFVCEKNLTNKEHAQLLQHSLILALANCFDTFSKIGNKVSEVLISCARMCSQKLFRVIKKGVRHAMKADENLDDVEDSRSTNLDLASGRYFDALIFILRIGIRQKDQQILELYSDLLVKVYEAIGERFEQLVAVVQTGNKCSPLSLDSQIFRLARLFNDYKDTVKGYLNHDFTEKLASKLTMRADGRPCSEIVQCNKKLVYNDLKSKLVALDERAKSASVDVYQTIINKQYGSVLNQNSVPADAIRKEKHCCSSYTKNMVIIAEVASLVFSGCEPKTYTEALKFVVLELENCDALDHPGLLYLFLLLECLIVKPQHSPTVKPPQSSFYNLREAVPKISCSLIRISKSVELGPSIIAFTKASSHKSVKSIQCCTYSNCIKIYTLMFSNYPHKITDPFITDAMQLCVSSNLLQYAKYNARFCKFFIQLASSISGLLRAISHGQKEEDTLNSTMPIFLTVLSHLIRCLILASDRRKVGALNGAKANGVGSGADTTTDSGVDNDDADSDTAYKEYETQLELLALDIGRTLNNLSNLRVKLVDYAAHLISAYVKDIQSMLCPEPVRLHLDEGIFRIFNLVDAHQRERHEEVVEKGVQRKTISGKASGSLFEMIHARLDQAGREILRDLHDKYSRFHRYQGKC